MFECYAAPLTKMPRTETIEEKVTQGVWLRGPTALSAHAESP
jgi:hypothetical protein